MYTKIPFYFQESSVKNKNLSKLKKTPKTQNNTATKQTNPQKIK